MEKAITIPAIISLAKNVLITQNVHIKFSEQFTQVIGLGGAIVKVLENISYCSLLIVC